MPPAGPARRRGQPYPKRIADIVPLAADDWDRHWADYAASAAANPAQAYRRRLVLALIARSGSPRRVLDIGAGAGDLAAKLASEFPDTEILGLDVSNRAVEMARARLEEATFLRDNLLDGREPEPQYRGWATHAVCSEVLEHVDDPRRLLENARAYMAPGCLLVVTVPGGPRSAFDLHIGHRRHFSPGDVRGVLEAAGFHVERAVGAGFPFFNLYRLLVVLRGRRLIEDVAGGAESSLARVTMGAFRALFRLNLDVLPWGWQTVGVARLPSGSAGD